MVSALACLLVDYYRQLGQIIVTLACGWTDNWVKWLALLLAVVDGQCTGMLTCGHTDNWVKSLAHLLLTCDWWTDNWVKSLAHLLVDGQCTGMLACGHTDNWAKSLTHLLVDWRIIGPNHWHTCLLMVVSALVCLLVDYRMICQQASQQCLGDDGEASVLGFDPIECLSTRSKHASSDVPSDLTQVVVFAHQREVCESWFLEQFLNVVCQQSQSSPCCQWWASDLMEISSSVHPSTSKWCASDLWFDPIECLPTSKSELT